MSVAAADWSFVRRPRWVLSHLFVLALVATMIAAGLWQIARHVDRADRNERVAARSAEPAQPLVDLVDAGIGPEFGNEAQYRRVEVTGEYQPGDQVLVRNRTLDGAPGWWVLTPLLLEPDRAVAVNRGWIPRAAADDPAFDWDAPSGTVTVVGSIQPTRTAGFLQQPDPTEGTLESLARPDIERLDAQVGYDVLPFVVQLEADADLDGLPVRLALPALDGGPHVSYAVQWFVFSTIALVGYPLILRRVARGEARSQPEEVLRGGGNGPDYARRP